MLYYFKFYRFYPLEEDMKQAQWIAPAGSPQMVPCHFLAWHTFTCAEIPESVLLKICAETTYILKLNGFLLGRGPAREANQAVFIDSYDATQYLHKGQNTVTVLVSCMNSDTASCADKKPSLWLELGDFTVTDESWTTALCQDEWPVTAPIFTPQLGFSEFRNLKYDSDLRLPPADRTVIIDRSDKKRLPRDIPRPTVTTYFPSELVTAAYVPPCDPEDKMYARLSSLETHTPCPADIVKSLQPLTHASETGITLQPPPANQGLALVFDFRHEITGRIEIELTASEGTIADFAYEDGLWENERVRSYHPKTNPLYQFSDRNVLRHGRQTAGNYAVDRGFRFVQITLRNFTGPLVIHSVRAIDSRYPFQHNASFICGDHRLNRIWDMARETISACTLDIFTDCPWRERLFYLNDLLVENKMALKLFCDPQIHRHAFELIFNSRRQDGLFSCIAPSVPQWLSHYNIPDFIDVILSANLTLVMEIYDYYMHTGDLELVRKHFATLQEILDIFRSWRDEQGIITPPPTYWNFFDWSYETNGTTFTGSPSALLNYLFIIARQQLHELAEVLGTADEGAEAEIDLMLKQTFQAFWDPEQNLLLDTTGECAAPESVMKALGCQLVDKPAPRVSRLTQAMAILAGAGTGPHDAILKAMMNENLLSPDLYYFYFIITAARKMGLQTNVLEYIRHFWGPIADTDSPTLWESAIGKKAWDGSCSLCHGFSSSPVDFLQGDVLGIQPLKPGFEEFSFAPKCPQLDFAHGTVPTPFGTIHASWTFQDGNFQADLKVPAGCTALTPAGNFGEGFHSFRF